VIVRDVAMALGRQQEAEPDLTSPLKMYVLPQLEDLPENTQIDAIDALLENDGIPFNRKKLRTFASDYFNIASTKLWSD
jgi:hypothetical protein